MAQYFKQKVTHMRNQTTEELQQALQQMASSLGLSVVEYVQSLGYATTSELTVGIDGLQSQITAIVELDGDNRAESLAEKLAAINEVLSSESGELQAIFTKIQENKQLVLDETARASAAEAALQLQITTNSDNVASNAAALIAFTNTVNANKAAQDNINSDVEARLTEAEAKVDTLIGDDTVVGSVDNKVKAEKTRAQLAEAANTKAVADESIRAIAAEEANAQAIAAMQSGSGATLAGLDVRLGEVEADLEDSLVDGETEKGLKTRVSDLEAAKVTQDATNAQITSAAEAYADSKVLGASALDICAIGNSFRDALGLSKVDCSAGGGDGDGAVL